MNTKKTTKSRVEAGMHVDLAGRRTYSEYLKLDRLFAAQQPVSQEHDEVAFIIIHHVQELWLKLVAHEIEAAMNSIRADHLPPAFKSLARVTRIQEQLITAWDVLSTITPADYLAFRSALGPASGFQSYQYRLVEFRLGAKDPEMLLPHRHDPIVHAKLTAVLNEPSLYDEALHLLARRGHPVPKEVLARDFFSALSVEPTGARHLAFDLSPFAGTLRCLRTRRGIGRRRGLVSAMAIPSHEDGRTHHW